MLVDVCGIGGGEDGAAVGENHDVFVHGVRGFADGLGGFGGLVEADGGVADADGSADCAADVGDDDVRSGFCHGFCFGSGGDVDDGEDVHLGGGEFDAVDFLLHAHVCLLDGLAELAVDDGVGGEVVDAGEAHGFHLLEEVPHAAAWV